MPFGLRLSFALDSAHVWNHPHAVRARPGKVRLKSRQFSHVAAPDIALTTAETVLEIRAVLLCRAKASGARQGLIILLHTGCKQSLYLRVHRLVDDRSDIDLSRNRGVMPVQCPDIDAEI